MLNCARGEYVLSFLVEVGECPGFLIADIISLSMTCIDQILSRRSVRKFKDEAVSEDVLKNFLESGRLAPSATNNQPWHFIVVRNSEGKDACDFQWFNRWVMEASLIVVGFYRRARIITNINSLEDRNHSGHNSTKVKFDF